MKKVSCMLLLLFLVSCYQSQRKKASKPESGANEFAAKIVQASIEKHGGWDVWKNVATISYKKTTILFDSMENEESNVTQAHYYELKPKLKGTITWLENTDSIKIAYTDSKATRYINGLEDTTGYDAARSVVESSLFVLFQPFKLVDSGVMLEYMGEEELEGVLVYVIHPIYGEEGEGVDEWWFYFDKETNQFIANMVMHNGRYSYIRNLEFDSSTPLILHAHRKSYFVDNLRNKKYLRAAYFYREYQLTFQDR